MLKLKTFLLSLVAVLLLTSSAQAADVSISPGDSISAAVARMSSGDTMTVRGGTYNMSSTSYSVWSGLPSGTAAKPTTVRAASGETPIFDGGNVQGEFMIPSGKSYLVLDGLTVQRFDNSFGNGAITPSGGSHHLTYQNMTFKDNGGTIDNDHDIYVGGSGTSDCSGRNHDISIHHNRFINGPGGALHMWHYCEGQNVYFYDNLVINKRVGVYACDDADNVRIYNNTFVSTANTGGTTFRTSCGEVKGPKSVYVRNNIIYRTAGTVWERGGDLLVEDHNLIFGGNVSWTLDSTDKRVDPQFVDVNGGDYRLRSGSPAIDAGTSTDAASNDFAYAPRPQGGGYDLGAYEAGGSPPPPPPPADTVPPTVPTGLVATSPSCTTGACVIHVTWTASTDSVGVDHYNEFRPLGTPVGTDPSTATSTDFGGSLPTCSTQTLGLQAEDAAHNKSAVASITATTYCPTSLDIRNFRRDPKTDTVTDGTIRALWDTPTAPVASYREWRDKNSNGVFDSNEMVGTDPASATSAAYGGGLPCGTTWLVGLEAVGTNGTIGPRVSARMSVKAC